MMKVLYLAPSRKRPEQITRYSFIDEEIVGLSEAGVEAYVLSASDDWTEDRGKIRMRPLPLETSLGERARTISFLLRHARLIPTGAWSDLPSLYHTVRIERNVADLVRSEKIDLIHSHFGSPGGLGGVLARAETGVPLVASLRGMDLLCDRGIDYGMRLDPRFDHSIRVLLSAADRTLYNSEFMRRKGISLGADPQRALTLRKGVDLVAFNGADRGAELLRAELGIRGPVILTVAGLIQRKGIDHLLEALALLRDSHRFSFVVCGKGPELSNLRALSRSLGLEHRTHFVGRVSREQIPRYFAACDLFLLGSIHEAAGNVVLEAMASSKPVVCTDSGGPPEYVEDGTTGFVVPVADPPAMAARISTLLDHSELRERFGRNGRAKAERQLDYGRMIEDMVSVYRGVARLPAGPARSRVFTPDAVAA